MSWPEPSPDNEYLAPHARILLQSFARWTGRALVDPALPPAEQARQLFLAPFAVVSHDTAPDPIFTYGNRTALALFELGWAEFTGMPSRLSAEPVHRAERERMLATVARQGYIDDYRGVRISKTGRRFLLERTLVWNLVDAAGAPCGQAATFDHWTYVDAPPHG